MKVDELRVLEVDELGVRMKSARRELYELRFKHAVGQLENTTEIAKVRHDIARIMTVLRERDLGIVVAVAPEVGEVDLETPELKDEKEAEAVAVAAEAPAKPKRGKKKAGDKT